MGLSIKWRAIIVLLSTAICCLMPALLLYFLGYATPANWNNNALKTTCNITDNYVTAMTCSYSCNCRWIGKIQRCDTCNRRCYNGYITVTYVDFHENIQYETVEVYSGQPSDYTVQKDLDNNYPTNSQIACYYQKDLTTNVRINLTDTTVFLAFFIVFCCLTGLIIIGWVGMELKWLKTGIF